MAASKLLSAPAPAWIMAAVAGFMALPAAAVTTFSLGGGMNLSTMNLDENEGGGQVDYSLRPGFNAGLGLDFFLNPSLALSPGLLLETRGQGVSSSGADSVGGGVSDVDVVYQLLYLQVPLHIRAAVPVGRKAALHIFAGPEVGITLASESTVKANFNGQQIKATSGIDAELFDFGISFGAGFRIPLQTLGLFLEPSYYFGFVDVAIPDDDPNTPQDESKETFHSQNRNFKLRAGIYKDL